jgi:hypothetical protein
MVFFYYIVVPQVSVQTSAVDRHRFDADPDPTFYFDVDPDPDPYPTSSYKQVGKSKFFLTFIHSNASLHCFIFLISVIGVVIFSIWTAY